MERRIKTLADHSEASEKNIEKYLVRRVKEMGGECLKFASMTDAGYPDRIVLLPQGRIMWVELKTTGKRPRKIQELRIARLRELGFVAEVADSKERVEEVLR